MLGQKSLLSLPLARRMAILALRLILDKGYSLQAALDFIFKQQQKKNNNFRQNKIIQAKFRQNKSNQSEFGQSKLEENILAENKSVKKTFEEQFNADLGLSTELVYGFCRLEKRLFFVLKLFLQNTGKIPQELLRLLILAVYELVHLEHIPAYATINFTVEAAGLSYGKSLSGLCNAVLRKIAASASEFSQKEFYAAKISEKTEFYAVWYSVPTWIFNIFWQNYPEEIALSYFDKFLQTVPQGFRLNTAKPDWQSLYQSFLGLNNYLSLQDTDLTVINSDKQCQSTPFSNSCIAFKPKEVPLNVEELIKQGKISKQSLGVAEVLGAAFAYLEKDLNINVLKEKISIWDCCAGRGGKTCFLLEHGYSFLAVADINFKRLQELKAELKRLDLPVPLLFRADAQTKAPLKIQPGLILADVPCSGLGTLARRPDIKFHRTINDVTTLINIQKNILSASFAALAEQGLLIYLTCTLNPSENEEQLAEFVKDNKNAKIIFEWRSPLNSVSIDFFWAGIIQKSQV